MLRKLVCSMFVMTMAIGFVAADEFNALVTKVDGNKVTYFKTKKGKKDGDAVTSDADKDVVVAKGSKDGKKYVEGDKIEGGLKKAFEKIDEDKGVLVRVTTDDDSKKITKILVMGKK